MGNGAGGDGEHENPSVKPSKRSFSLIGCHWKEKEEDYKCLYLLKSNQVTYPIFKLNTGSPADIWHVSHE